MDNRTKLKLLNFSLIENSPEQSEIYLIDKESNFSCDSNNEIDEYELSFCKKLKWYKSPMIFLLSKNEKGKVLLSANFYIFNSYDIPISSGEVRNYFDYRVEPELKIKIDTDYLYIGPYWNYIYETNNIKTNLLNKKLRIFAGVSGNNLNISGSTIDEVFQKFEEAKLVINRMVPFPIFYGLPVGKTVGSVDNYYDNNDSKWYHSTIRDNDGVVLSILDVPKNLDDVSFKYHSFTENPKSVKDFDLPNRWIYFLDDKNKVINKRKIKNLNILD